MYLVLIIYFVVLSVWDIRKKGFPVSVLLLGLGASLIYGILRQDGMVIFLGIVPGMLLILMGFLTREKVGYGDGILVIIIGLVLGWPGSFLVYVIAQFGVLFFAVFLLLAKRSARDVKIPFAPFLTVGLVLYQIGGFI